MIVSRRMRSQVVLQLKSADQKRQIVDVLFPKCQERNWLFSTLADAVLTVTQGELSRAGRGSKRAVFQDLMEFPPPDVVMIDANVRPEFITDTMTRALEQRVFPAELRRARLVLLKKDSKAANNESAA